jgi:hypothetical protein
MSSISALRGAPTPAAAGWYSDPSGGRQARWWDGEEWTSHVQALPMGEPPEEAWVEESRLVPSGSSWARLSLRWGIVAVVANILMAPTVLAFVFGVMALRRHDRLESLGYELGSRRTAVLGVVFGAVGILMTVGWIVVLRLVTHASP